MSIFAIVTIITDIWEVRKDLTERSMTCVYKVYSLRKSVEL